VKTLSQARNLRSPKKLSQVISTNKHFLDRVVSTANKILGCFSASGLNDLENNCLETSKPKLWMNLEGMLSAFIISLHCQPFLSNFIISFLLFSLENNYTFGLYLFYI
jgi:hypothetical protein